jgi:uncharacterized membrane protein
MRLLINSESVCPQDEFLFIAVSDIAQEKTLKNIEGYDKTKLKHTEVKEKHSMPDAAG